MSEDPYTMDARLCDDDGMVSHERTPPNLFDAELTYLKQLNNLRAMTGLAPYEGEPFTCTGSAHLAREHIRCTSPTHYMRPLTVVLDLPSLDAPSEPSGGPA